LVIDVSRLWTPPSVSYEHRQVTERQNAELMAAARRDALCDFWDKELQKIDPKLTLIQAKENAEVPGLKPGFWHIIRVIDGGPPAILPLVGDEGEFVEPAGKMLEVLRAGDLQNPRAMEARARQDEESARRRVRDRERAHDDRVTEMTERLASLTQTRVSMSTDTPWSQNVQGRRGVKKD
jgi:hypothetical protein